MDKMLFSDIKIKQYYMISVILWDCSLATVVAFSASCSCHNFVVFTCVKQLDQNFRVLTRRGQKGEGMFCDCFLIYFQRPFRFFPFSSPPPLHSISLVKLPNFGVGKKLELSLKALQPSLWHINLVWEFIRKTSSYVMFSVDKIAQGVSDSRYGGNHAATECILLLAVLLDCHIALPSSFIQILDPITWICFQACFHEQLVQKCLSLFTEHIFIGFFVVISVPVFFPIYLSILFHCTLLLSLLMVLPSFLSLNRFTL